jgi:hypothetical protein
MTIRALPVALICDTRGDVPERLSGATRCVTQRSVACQHTAAPLRPSAWCAASTPLSARPATARAAGTNERAQRSQHKSRAPPLSMQSLVAGYGSSSESEGAAAQAQAPPPEERAAKRSKPSFVGVRSCTCACALRCTAACMTARAHAAPRAQNFFEGGGGGGSSSEEESSSDSDECASCVCACFSCVLSLARALTRWLLRCPVRVQPRGARASVGAGACWPRATQTPRD